MTRDLTQPERRSRSGRRAARHGSPQPDASVAGWRARRCAVEHAGVRRRAGRDPFRDAERERRALPASACAAESRVSWRGAGCSAGTCACSLGLPGRGLTRADRCWLDGAGWTVRAGWCGPDCAARAVLADRCGPDAHERCRCKVLSTEMAPRRDRPTVRAALAVGQTTAEAGWVNLAVTSALRWDDTDRHAERIGALLRTTVDNALSRPPSIVSVADQRHPTGGPFRPCVQDSARNVSVGFSMRSIVGARVTRPRRRSRNSAYTRPRHPCSQGVDNYVDGECMHISTPVRRHTPAGCGRG